MRTLELAIGGSIAAVAFEAVFQNLGELRVVLDMSKSCKPTTSQITTESSALAVRDGTVSTMTNPLSDLAHRLSFSMREVAAVLGISYVSVHRLAKRGLLRPSRALRTPKFSRAELERFLNETR